MNPEELKIGDLVRVVKDDYIIQKDTICKVIGISTIDLSIFGGHKSVVSLLTIKTEDIRSMSYENIEGIFLTKEIIEKNGYKKTKISSHEYYYYKYGLFLSYTLNSNKFRFNDFSGISVELPYVHSLQHLLFGLGINHEMEV